ncbi:hypothetical protein F8B43_5359 [Methylorubrum populi]|uniref:Hedgehog/Intein (Hint) domain-containing protein n=2 Tax=Methylorubrum TaxID=2282523 RepID=A0A833J1Z3_9HYPH|nr:hypothetical protein F8B43_5359 [Methylorubrum populi]
MAETFDNQTFGVGNSTTGVLLGVPLTNTTTFTGTNAVSGLTGVTIDGAVDQPGSSVQVALNVGGVAQASVAGTYRGFSQSSPTAEPIYYFDTTVAGVGTPVTVAVSAGPVPLLSAAAPIDTSNVTAPDSPLIVCFVTGTRIRTERGEVAVEDLQIGDLAVTASGAHKPIRWIGHRLVEAADHAAPQDVWPVRITAGALAMGVPVRDLLVSPDHCLVFDDVLVPAKHLINGATIRQEPVEAVGYWHIELDSHEALLAEGAPAESYRDCGMHAFFEGAEGWGHRVGDKAPVALLAPHALSGPRLHGVKAILIARAKHLGARRVEDPGLQVVADGQVLTPASIDNRRFTFAVPEGTQTLVLRSRSSVPAHWIAENEDRRRLGVRVSELCADGTAVAMADAQLAQGWNAVEPNGQERWTEGEAHLPVCRALSFQADWFLGYPVETVSEPMPVNAAVSFAAPVLRLVANG